ncbi:unnamed protein product [Polarella glacialis]|uniref:Glycosyltransferase 2-like domain-containing protein n=1 Tax=Polarella glacialis TaxID=89957 RepID=A0A813EIL5_POLGL|nr:unnamed protein product [Polarella glacialis]
MSSGSWIIAIPSFDRLESIQKKTLAVLKEAGIDPGRINVFADPSQHTKYEQQLKPLGISVHRGDKGIHGQRNAIMRHFKPGSRVVEMDDDITGFTTTDCAERNDRKAVSVLVPKGNMEQVIDHLWEVSERRGCALWGVYSMMNPFFMSHTYTVGLAKSTAQVQGYINPGGESMLTVPVMEDYERCLLLYSRGQRCLRANYLAVKTQNRGRGGCASAFTTVHLEKGVDGRTKILRHPRNVLESKAAAKLQETYPSCVQTPMPPKAAKMTVPIHGEVLYHPPGWRLLFKRQLSTTIRATDVRPATKF